MTAQLAQQQLEKLRREREQAAATIEEYQAKLPVFDAQIAALEPIAHDPSEAAPASARVVTQPGKSKAS